MGSGSHSIIPTNPKGARRRRRAIAPGELSLEECDHVPHAGGQRSAGVPEFTSGGMGPPPESWAKAFIST